MARTLLSFLLILVPSFSLALHGPGGPESPAGAFSTVTYYPIVVVGGGSNSLLTLFNFAEEQQTISISIVTDEGETVFSGGAALPAKATTTFDLLQTLEGRTDVSEARGFWVRATSSGPFSSSGLQTLEVGGQSLLPYGVLSSPACQRMTVVLNETETLRSAVALLNPGGPEVSCTMTAYRGTQGAIDSADIQLEGRRMASFFLTEQLDLGPNFQGAADIVCESPASGYSLLQDSATGNTTAVSVECVDAPSPAAAVKD